jgi:hypothetical protein
MAAPQPEAELYYDEPVAEEPRIAQPAPRQVTRIVDPMVLIVLAVTRRRWAPGGVEA